MPEFLPGAIEAVRDLAARFPGAPFLTLGQTVLWDEPVKAAFCRLLEEAAPDATMVAAIHDTDYFAKLAGDERTHDEPFLMLPHNDGDTRGLWSAAGEISCLFGSETVPTRGKLAENGVAIERVARSYPGGLEALLNEETNAWGWRALVHTQPHPLIAADVKLNEIAPALRRQIEWGLDESLRFIQTEDAPPQDGCECATPCDARETASRIRGWLDEYCFAQPEATLSDFYCWLTPKLWAMVRGGGACNLQTGDSMQLFRFNRQTAKLPRFRFVDLFVQSSTREVARRCYDGAVGGSGIYTLDQFGAGALPFDVVIPGRGRGTLRIHNGSVCIETEKPITICSGCNPASIEELAETLEAQLGPDIALVGKAVSLISMLAHEYIFVFHEKASGYTALTQKMNAALREAGIGLNLKPLLRVRHSTWDALDTTNTNFDLPPHLAAAFGAKQINAKEFAARWQSVCDEQDELRANLKNCRSPRELLSFLSARDESWQSRMQEYSAARQIVKDVRAQTEVLQREVEELREAAHEVTQKAGEVERKKGEYFRTNMQPLRERIFDIKEAAAARINPLDENGQPKRLNKEERKIEAERAENEADEIESLRMRIEERQIERWHFDKEINILRRRARKLSDKARERVLLRVELERSEEIISARAVRSRLEYEAELERLRLVRAAIWTSEGLRYTNFRPTAWWFPLVSPRGEWFERLVGLAQARIEEL